MLICRRLLLRRRLQLLLPRLLLLLLLPRWWLLLLLLLGNVRRGSAVVLYRLGLRCLVHHRRTNWVVSWALGHQRAKPARSGSNRGAEVLGRGRLLRCGIPVLLVALGRPGRFGCRLQLALWGSALIGLLPRRGLRRRVVFLLDLHGQALGPPALPAIIGAARGGGAHAVGEGDESHGLAPHQVEGAALEALQLPEEPGELILV